MIEVGETVAEFTLPMVTPELAARAERGSYTSDDVETFSLAEALSEGPVVVATFPGVYSRTCTQELCELRDWIDELTGLDAAVYGLSVDTPWSQLAFVDEYDLSYPLLSTFSSDLPDELGIRRTSGVLAGITGRVVLVIAPDRTVTYAWETEESLTFPDLEAIEAAVESAGE